MWQVFKPIDDFLNNITMYRLVLYYLIVLVVLAILLSFMGILPFSGVNLALSAIFLLAVGVVTNAVFAKVFEVAVNEESVYISALILTLLITPSDPFKNLSFLFWASVWTMASKFIFALGKKHLFNPVALAILLTAIFLNYSASWWVGNVHLIPAVLLGGFLIVRKIRREDLFWGFAVASLFTIVGISALRGISVMTTLQKTLFDSPWLFFSTVMLTEPLTTPPTKKMQIYYGALVGFLFSPQIHLGSIYTTPEIALLMGNLFSYLVSPKEKLILKLKEKIQLTPDIYDFVFGTDKKMNYTPGQYMELTLGHNQVDDRGNRRYFTLASSPTEDNLRIGVKFYQPASSFKKSLLNINDTDLIVAAQCAGDFVLPKNPNTKLVFIAGGIGITPFRSMMKYLLDTNQKRDIVLFYAVKKESDIVYKDIFELAKMSLGIKVVYVVADTTSISPNWMGKTGYLTSEVISAEVSDFKARTFYLSGPRSLVDAFENNLSQLGLKKEQIKTDYFPGFV